MAMLLSQFTPPSPSPLGPQASMFASLEGTLESKGFPGDLAG